VKQCLINCSEQQQPNEQTDGDLTKTTTYESTDLSTSADDAAYTSLQKPEGDYEVVDYENADAVVPANRSYSSLTYDYKDVDATVPVYSN